MFDEKIAAIEISLDNKNLEDTVKLNEELKLLETKHLSKFVKSKLRQNLESLFIALALALFVREFIVQPFKIPSGSMMPNLLVGDHLLVTKFIYGTKLPFTSVQILPGVKDIEYGDVIVFVYPNGDNEPSKKGVHYIKRVVGLPGDSINIKNRNLLINGHNIPLEYEGSYDSNNLHNTIYVDEYEEDLFGSKHKVVYQNGRKSTDKGLFIPIDKIPENHYFVMGDNRDNSRDSRYWGLVPAENISGKALLTHWSWVDPTKLVSNVRWERIFKFIN
ncbi:MAG: signal peptidase I [Candidatus Dadabacteria bacterium]|nr:signal peptidase I [Candidatus Dadabacteria bacterium]NIT14110.1 signal peptidase I [Candidatus Dadabacteria bacterium]